MELLKALPESLALQFLKNELGDEALNKILDKKHDFYAKERNNDPNGEPVLLYADGIDYLEITKPPCTRSAGVFIRTGSPPLL